MNIIKGNKLVRRAKFIIKKLERKIAFKAEINVFGNEPNQIQQIYIINLDRQKNRWKEFRKEAGLQKTHRNQTLLEFSSRISAIDANSDTREIDRTKIVEYYPLSDQYYVDPDPRLLSIIRKKPISVTMTKEEIAVAMSHIRAWETLVNEGKDYALIVEDDIYFEKTFASSINQIWHELVSNKEKKSCLFDLLYLSFKEVSYGYDKQDFSESLSIPNRGLWWLSGYVLSFEGAKRLLAELPIRGPVDLWINHKFKDLNVFAAKKSILSQRTDFDSDNSYSILPILSQIGIQSDKTHLELEQKKGRSPVFVVANCCEIPIHVGLALKMLGYRCCINKWNEWENSIENAIQCSQPLLFDAYVGFSSILSSYEELDNLYPSAVFIFINKEGNNIQNHEPVTSNNATFFEALNYFDDIPQKCFYVPNFHSIDWVGLTRFLKCQKGNLNLSDLQSENGQIPEIDLDQYNAVPVIDKPKAVLQHDVHPWIIPFNNLEDFGVGSGKRTVGRLIGEFKSKFQDKFDSISSKEWIILEDSFPSNLAKFSKENIIHNTSTGGIEFIVKNNLQGKKKFTSASIATESNHLYGKFEVEIKPLKAPGVVTAFFLHRNDPWQEIDFEFLGNDTTKFLANIYYNPGIESIDNNYGNRGTPIIIELGFDASLDFHKYSIEWNPHEVRWYVDNELVHVRANWEPSPIPDLPMKFFLNTWPTISEELAGNINHAELPKSTFLKSVEIQTWTNNQI